VLSAPSSASGDPGHASARDAVSLADFDGCKAADATEAADFVKFTEWGDCDWSPFLNCRGIHAAGFLSGHRLEIKDPSRGATLGGFALDSAHGRHSQENDGGLRCR
jgi:hypothetical protein